MHFYKLCCEAAGEDLTEFFRAHGFFTVMSNRFVGDYANSEYTLTQSQIDAAIAEVKTKKYEENIAVLFITDATGDKTIKSHKGGTLTPFGPVCGELGSYNTFVDATAASNYTYAVSGQTMTMANGKGGVGFAVLNDKNELLSFSDKKVFSLSLPCVAALAEGKAKVYVVNADNTLTKATNVIESGNSTAVGELLNTLLQDSKSLIDLKDTTGKKVGFYTAEAVAELEKAYTAAKKVSDNQTTGSYASAYEKLFQEYAKVLNNDLAKIPFVPYSTYVVTNVRTNTKSLTLSNKKTTCAATNMNSKLQQWIFESAGNGGYYLKNKSTQTYIDSIQNNIQGTANATTTEGLHAYKLVDLGSGQFALECQNKEAKSLNYNDELIKVLGWGYNGDSGSWWTLTMVENFAEANEQLEALLEDTKAMFDACGAVQISSSINAVALQVNNPTGENYLSTNADQNVVGNKTDGGGIKALLDGQVNTYMHTQWGGEAVNEEHYVQVSLLDADALKEFCFTYATRGGTTVGYASPVPTHIEVMGSIDGETFTSIQTFKSTDAINPLPAYSEIGKSWTSSVIDNQAGYKYFRFVVKESRGPGNNRYEGHYFFAMSEFGIGTPKYDVQFNENFGGVEEEFMISAKNELTESELASAQVKSTDDVNKLIAKVQEVYDALYAATHHTLNVNQYGYATLYLPYAVAIPADAKAYIVTEANNQGWAVLKEVAGQVLPANTGVVVEANQGECQFAYSTEAPAAVSGNMLEGSTTTGKKAIEAGYKYFVLGATDGQVGLYLAQKYNANGNAVAATSTNATQFQVTANKAYLPVNGAAAAYYVFKLNGATGIDSAVSAPAAQGIYDLNGQRVSTLVRSGIYIVNGQKCFIQVK
jgi:hypothetical protein